MQGNNDIDAWRGSWISLKPLGNFGKTYDTLKSLLVLVFIIARFLEY